MTDQEQTDQEQKEWDLKLRKIDAQIANLNAATDTLITENKWYIPALFLGAGSALAFIAIALARLFF